MKRIIKKITLLSLLCLCASTLSAQTIKDIRINEILVKNVNSYEDDYGHRSGWIELHNTGYSNVNVAGNFLTVRRGDKTKTYKIPKNDPRTIIPPQGYLVFFADGVGSKGTFYTNFTLDETGVVLLLDASGRGPAIDSVSYDLPSLKEDISLGYEVKAMGEDAAWGELSSTTPGATNNTIEFISRDVAFKQHDPSGGIMAITAMSVVFCALIVLYQVFKQIGLYYMRVADKKDRAAQEASGVPSTNRSSANSKEINAEIIAAIAVALRKYEEDLHDVESAVLTINRVAKIYSPWSSKIYSMVPPPDKKNNR